MSLFEEQKVVFAMMIQLARNSSYIKSPLSLKKIMLYTIFVYTIYYYVKYYCVDDLATRGK